MGFNYKYNEQWLLRAGTGYDQTPTKPPYRNTRLPDTDRVAFSGGFHTKLNQALSIDFGYTYLLGAWGTRLSRACNISVIQEIIQTITAQISNHAQIAALQIVWDIDNTFKSI